MASGFQEDGLTVCQPCGYQRKAVEEMSKWSCPQCGKAYPKEDVIGPDAEPMPALDEPVTNDSALEAPEPAQVDVANEQPNPAIDGLTLSAPMPPREDKERVHEAKSQYQSESADVQYTEVDAKLELDVAKHKGTANLIYILYALSYFVLFTPIIGLIIAYVNKDEALPRNWVKSHYKYQISTFWYSLLWTVLGYGMIFLLLLAGSGGALIFFIIVYFLGLAIWFLYRVVKGWLAHSREEAIYLGD